MRCWHVVYMAPTLRVRCKSPNRPKASTSPTPVVQYGNVYVHCYLCGLNIKHLCADKTFFWSNLCVNTLCKSDQRQGHGHWFKNILDIFIASDLNLYRPTIPVHVVVPQMRSSKANYADTLWTAYQSYNHIHTHAHIQQNVFK